MLSRKNLLTAALTSASLASIAMPTSAWAQATPNVTADCTEAVEENGNNPAATQFDPVTGDPILDPVTGDPVLVAAGDTIPFSTQCGVKSQASGSGATALGNVAIASGAFSTAVGAGSFALADGSVALGSGASVAVGATNSVALGAGSIANNANVVSVGSGNPADAATIQFRKIVNVKDGTAANDAVNKGQLDAATVDNAFIFINAPAGSSVATAANTGAIAIGSGSEANGLQSTAMGNFARANEANSVALGSAADAGVTVLSATPLAGTALGTKAKVKGAADNSVALGFGAIAEEADVISVGRGPTGVAADGPATRKIVNVTAGTADTDAVNVFQLKDEISKVSGGANPFVVIDTTNNQVDASAGEDSVAIGANSVGSGLASVAVGGLSNALGAQSAAFGFGANASGEESVALGGDANVFAAAKGGVAIGIRSFVDDSGVGSVAIGSDAVADRANTVSFGAGVDAVAGVPVVKERQLVNVAAGTAATDAVNKAQLDGSFVGSNAALTGVIDGRFTVSNTTFKDAVDDVISALGIGGAGNAFVDVNPGVVAGVVSADADASVAGSVAIGGAATASAANSVALGEGSVANVADTVSVGNATLKRKIVNVKEGTADNDAVNVKQLNDKFASVSGVAVNLGGLTAPSAAISKSIAIGGDAVAGAEKAIAIGANVSANGSGSIALGASTTADGAGSVALGETSIAGEDGVISVGSGSGLAADKLSTRKIVNVKAGTGDNDAVNFAQLQAVKLIAETNAGGGVGNAFIKIDTTTATTAPNTTGGQDAVAIGGSTVATAQNAVALGSFSTATVKDTVSFGNDTLKRKIVNIADGSAASDAATFGQLEALRLAIGAGGGAGGGVVAPANLFVAVKEVAGAAPANAAVAGTVALGGGSNARAADTVAIGEGANAALAGATALGSAANASGAGATAIGRQASATSTNGTALGNGANVSLTADNSVALGAGSVATEANMVSIGSGKAGDAFATRRLTNVTAGQAGTDAVNINQLNEVKNLLTTGGVGNGFLAIEVAAADKAANAAGAGSLALGGNSQALAANAVAVGNGAIAKDGAAVSIGLGNTASGNGAVAIGDPNTATGQGAVALGFTNTATGLAAVALGSESQAVGDSAFAQGNKAKAIGFSALALGEGAVAELQNVSNPPSNPAEPNPGANIAIGLGAKAIAQTTIAIGNGAVADAEDATVVGDKSKAAFHATAIGGEVIASGRGSQAFGWQTNALGNTSTALGFRANAVGNGSITVGANTRAEGLNATAIGAGATANFANSTAIGTGAAATRADQIVLGRKAVTANGVTTPGTSVTFADIAASTAAQVGPTDVITVDATGTVGRDASIRPAIASLQAGQQELFDLANLNRREARRGIAAASALVAAPMPSEPGKTTVVGGTAFYRGEGAFSFSFNHRLNLEAPVSFGGGVAHSGGKDTVVRAHVATEF